MGQAQHGVYGVDDLEDVDLSIIRRYYSTSGGIASRTVHQTGAGHSDGESESGKSSVTSSLTSSSTLSASRLGLRFFSR